jgi:integrase/recombinase XerD
VTTTTAPRRKVAKKTPSPRARATAAAELPPHPTRGRKLPAEILTNAELDSMLRTCSLRAPSGIRDRALIGFLAGSGLRISEALALRPCDIDRQTGTVRVLHGKGNQATSRGATEAALLAVDRWLDVRAKLGAKPAHALFCAISAGKVGRPMDASQIRHMFKRRAARAGIVKRVHVHGMRHKYATDLIAAGCPINELQVLLGHRHLVTTVRYVQQLPPEVAIRNMRARMSQTAPPTV